LSEGFGARRSGLRGRWGGLKRRWCAGCFFLGAEGRGYLLPLFIVDLRLLRERERQTTHDETTRHNTKRNRITRVRRRQNGTTQSDSSSSIRFSTTPNPRCRSRLNRLLQTAIPIPLKLVRPLFLPLSTSSRLTPASLHHFVFTNPYTYTTYTMTASPTSPTSPTSLTPRVPDHIIVTFDGKVREMLRIGVDPNSSSSSSGSSAEAPRARGRTRVRYYAQMLG
jgi:hypothetical protein